MNASIQVAPPSVIRSVLLLLMSGLFLPVVLSAAPGAERPNLAGFVKADTGRPLPGARVFIYTAGPKEGAGILCPSCYADCTKQATTDAEGAFAIEELDPTLLFQILAVAPGFQPKFESRVDPAAGQIEVALKPVSGGDAPGRRLRGRVLGPDSKPVSGAVISIRGVTRGTSTRFGGNNDVDPVAVSDEEGEFTIHGEADFDAAGLEVEARGLAKRVFQKLTTGNVVHELKLTEGASVKGRLFRDAKPVAGAEVGICGADRRSEIFIGDFSVATDDEGRFLFVNLPPGTRCFLYGLMRSLGEKGSLAARTITTEEDGSMLDLGDINLDPGYAVAGKIRLSDGQPIPENTRVLIGRKEAWDTLQAEVDEQGRFRFSGVPAESVTLSARLKGYRYSSRNRSLDLLNPFRLVGRVHADKTDLIIELEQGDRHQPTRGVTTGLEEEPLRGAEDAEIPSGDIKVTGTVTDAGTGKPLKSFTVTEGRADQFREDFNWFWARRTTCTNGAFTVYFMKQRWAPAVLIEAEGYLPQTSGAINVAETNLSIALKKGTGPNGVVLTPDGQPASGVKVYLADMRDGVYVDNSSMKAREAIYQQTQTAHTDEHGKFSFAPDVSAYAVLALDEEGYAEVKVDDLEEEPEVRLQPWAKVEGQLRIGSRAGTNEVIRLGLAHLPYEHHPRHFSPLQLYLTTTTDEEGRFEFERVPPISVEVYHEPKVRESRVGTVPVSQNLRLTLNPGETHQLTLGGKGRPVVGQMVINGYEGEIDWRADVQSLELVVPEPLQLPDLLALSRKYGEAMRAATTEEEKDKARAEYERNRDRAVEKTRAFYASEAGRQYHFAKRRYALNFAQDGTFRIDDVPGGRYLLKMDLREGSGGSPSRFSLPRIANLEKELEVPDAPGGRSDEPVDIGVIELQARNAMKPGKAAPDFEVKTLDDKTIRLSDFKGKYVLLDFWAVWCGPCVAETPHLKEVYDTFKEDPRFVMIGLSLDPDASATRDYAKKNELGWIQGFLGEWSKTEVPARFGVEGIPSIMLIGPDGKVVAAGLRGERIKTEVQSALAKAKP